MQLERLKLQNLQHIDIEIGLKYLNNNQELYLKILNNFLERYGDLKLDLLSLEELKDVVHTIKGLSATLGMSALSQISKEIDVTKIKNYKNLEFELDQVLQELMGLFVVEDQLKTILILNDQEIEIDNLLNSLECRYDLLITLDHKEATELISIENIDLFLLRLDLKDTEGMDDLLASVRQKNIPIILSTSSQILKKHEEFLLVNGSESHQLITAIETMLTL